MPANAGATHPRASVGCELSGTSSNALRRQAAVRHDPHHHVLPPDNARNHPSIAIVLKRVVLLFWHTLAHRPLTHRRLGPLKSFPSSSAMTARTPNPLFVGGPPSTPASRLALPTTDARRGCWRCTVSPFLSRSHTSPRGLIVADEAAVPCPARLHPGRAISTLIASSCRARPSLDTIISRPARSVGPSAKWKTACRPRRRSCRPSARSSFART